MAGEEDVELRDLVAQSLETKGVLGKIRVGPFDITKLQKLCVISFASLQFSFL